MTHRHINHIEDIMNILILGCGQLGQALAEQLHQAGHQVTAVSRSAKQLSHGITHLSQDIQHLDLTHLNTTFDWVYVILSPSERSLFGYQQAYVNTIQPITQALQHHPVQKLIYISSTRVYGQSQGEIVDDTTPPENHDPYAQILRSAELLWSAYWQDKLTIIRLSGLYRGESERLQQMAKNLEYIDEKHWINLIHRHDVVQILALLPTAESLQSSYIFTTNAVIQSDLLNHIRKKLGFTEIVANAVATFTGKQLVATRLQTLLKQIDYQLQWTGDVDKNVN